MGFCTLNGPKFIVFHGSSHCIKFCFLMVTFDLISEDYNCYTGLQGICEEPNSEIHLYLLSIIFQVVGKIGFAITEFLINRK